MAAFIVSALETPETTGFAKSTVQLPHRGELPPSVTLTLAMDGEPGVDWGGAVGVEASVPVGVGTSVPVGVGTVVGLTWARLGLGDDPNGM
jgi:hypothetical protein